LPLLKPMPIEQNTSNKSMSDLIEERVVDATLGTSLPEAIRSNPDIVRLFPNYAELEKAFYKRTKIYPIMHLVAIRKPLYERYPFIATSLYNAFCESKKIALEKMFNLRALRYMTPFLMRDIDEIYELFDGDPWPYGVEPNRPTLEAFVTYLTDQSLIAAPVPVDDLFVPTYYGSHTSSFADNTWGHLAMSNLDTVIQDRVIANRILAREDVVDAYGHVSIRHPDNPKHFFLARSRAPELVEPHDIVELGLDGQPVR